MVVDYTDQQALNVIANGLIGITSLTDAQKVSPTDGSKDVTTAGTAEALLAAATDCRMIFITAKSANTGSIFVGSSSVASINGTELTAGETIVLEAGIGSKIDVNEIFVDSGVSGEGVTFTYWG